MEVAIFMAKYKFEFKFRIVQKYFDGEGLLYLANKYELKDKKQILRWLNIYKEFSEEVLFRKHQNQKYSVQFKLDAIELYQTSEMSCRDVANAIGINNPPLIVIASWIRKFREDGVDGLSKTKGCPSNMSKKKKTVKKLYHMRQLEKATASKI